MISFPVSAITEKDLFMRVVADKQNIQEQEPVVLIYKIYSLVDLIQLDGNLPDLAGFHIMESELPLQRQFHEEILNGKMYKCAVWSRYVLYPQMTGDLEIPSVTYKGLYVQNNANSDIIEELLNDGTGYTEEECIVRAPSIIIHVNPLPPHPKDFSGGVGSFDISASINKDTLNVGEPISLSVKVTGKGNLKLLKAPLVAFPNDFETFDVKIIDNVKFTSNGYEGSVTFNYSAIPINQGVYTISPATLTYYDVNVKRYKTICTQSFHLKVDKGNYVIKEDRDIHPIKKGNSIIRATKYLLFGSWIHICILGGIFLCYCLTIVCIYIMRKNGKSRMHFAYKKAMKRLNHAAQLKDGGKYEEFYNELYHTLWEYAATKFNIPLVSLTTDGIRDELFKCKIDETTIGNYIRVLKKTEYERFSPNRKDESMGKFLKTAIKAIKLIEERLKKDRRNMILFLFFCYTVLPIGAVTKQVADAEYMNGNYQQAIKDYNELLKNGVSADLYYNLGNAYYHTRDLSQTILSYEKAKLLAPIDSDIIHNLYYVYSKTKDGIIPRNENIFTTLYLYVVTSISIDGWVYVGIIAILVAMVSSLFVFFSTTKRFSNFIYTEILILLIVFTISFKFAYQQKRLCEGNGHAIVISSILNVKQTPNIVSHSRFTIHEGTRVRITDKSMKGWNKIKLDDEREGWVQCKEIEEIKLGD